MGETLSSNKLLMLSGNKYFHNFLLQSIVCNGLLFAFSLIIFVIWSLKNSLKNKNKTILIATQVALLIYGLTEHFDLFLFGLMSVCMTILYAYLPLIGGKIKNEQ